MCLRQFPSGRHASGSPQSPVILWGVGLCVIEPDERDVRAKSCENHDEDRHTAATGNLDQQIWMLQYAITKETWLVQIQVSIIRVFPPPKTLQSKVDGGVERTIVSLVIPFLEALDAHSTAYAEERGIG